MMTEQKTNPVQRLHNICDALAEQMDGSAFSREEWERIDAENAALRARVASLSREAHTWWTALAAAEKEASRYRALRELGAAPADWPGLEQGNVLRFTNLDEHADALLRRRPADVAPPRAVAPPEFQEVSWGVDATMRPVKGLAVSDYAFRQWARDVGIVLTDDAPGSDPQSLRSREAGQLAWDSLASPMPPPGSSAELLDIVQTIELGLKRGYTPAELLDENSPIRDRMRAAAHGVIASADAQPKGGA